MDSDSATKRTGRGAISLGSFDTFSRAAIC